MVPTTPLGSSANTSTRKHSRKRYDPVRRLEVAKTRKLGACMDCRKRKVRCLHAQELVKGGGFVLPESLSPESSAHLNTAAQPTLESRAVGDNELETHGDLRDGTPSLDFQLWDDIIMPFDEVESYASQNPMVATTKGYAVATSSPPAPRSNMWTMLQPTDEISSGYMAQAMHERSSCSYSDTLSYPSMRNWAGSPEAWDTAPPLYPYSSQISNPLHQPPIPELNCSKADHALLTSVASYPQDGGQWRTGYECHQPTTLCPTANFDQTTGPKTFHTSGNMDVVDFGSVLSSENTIENSNRD